jgi:hypothetical protein
VFDEGVEEEEAREGPWNVWEDLLLGRELLMGRPLS